MKFTFYLLIIAITVISCGEKTPPKNTVAENVTKSTESNLSDHLEGEHMKASYETLKTLLENNAPITNEYLTDSIPVYGKALNDHSIVNEADKYILVKASGGETDISSYYLVTFSKGTGKLIDYIGLGQLAEGADPYKVIWESNNSFSTVNYQYELLEDEESGAYVKGALLDSIVLAYNINANGVITAID